MNKIIAIQNKNKLPPLISYTSHYDITLSVLNCTRTFDDMHPRWYDLAPYTSTTLFKLQT